MKANLNRRARVARKAGLAALARKNRIQAADDVDIDSDTASMPVATDADSDDFRRSRTPADALADELLAAALPRDVLRRLMRGDPVAVVITVPSSDYIDPIADAIRALTADPLLFRRDGSQRRDHMPDVGNDDVADALRRGRPVVGVSQSPAAFLPSSLLALADAKVAVRAPDGATLRRVLIRCRRRPVPRTVADDACAGLGFHEIAATFRHGASGRDVLAGLAKLRAARASPAADPDVPTLDRLPGFSGEARKWAEKLAADWKRWRSGDIPFAALDSSAMIYGPPGVGKTMFVRSLARTLGVPLHETSPGAWFAGKSDGALGGVSQAFMRSWETALADARNTGAIWYLDEADGLPDRATLSDRAREWWQSLLSLVLTTMSSGDRTGLCVIGSCNAGSSAAPNSSIDAAVRRRFGRGLVVGLPMPSDLAEVVSFWTDGALSAADVLPVVTMTTGASAATAATWARDAMNMARDAGRAVTVDDILAVAVPADTRPAPAVWRTAVHEAAHAVVAEAMGRRVVHATVVETADRDGSTRMQSDPAEAMTASSVDRMVIATLAGRAGEEVVFGEPSAGAEGDLADATAALAAVHASTGIGLYLTHRAPSANAAGLLKYDPTLREIVEQHLAGLYAEALAQVRAHRGAIEHVARALVERRLLSGDDIRALIAAAPAGGEP